MIAEPSLTERLSAHLLRSPNESDRQRARLQLLDWLGCVAGARQSAVADVANAAEPDLLLRAALLGNGLEMDDVYRAAILHPGPVVWPAALAALRGHGGDMVALLDGAIRGYEAMIAIGSTFDPRHYAFYHNTATAGGFGAAAAAASIFALDQAQLVAALGNAGSVSGGLWQMRHEPVMTKAMHVAHAVRTGLWQARLARHGLTGPAGILEGPQGLYAATCAAPRPMALDPGWRIHAVSNKPWGACRHAHPAIDAALALRAEAPLEPPIRIETFADAIAFCDRPDPVSVIEAKFSLQHAVAVVAARGVPQLADFEPDAIAALARTRAMVTVAEADEFTARYPEHFGARVSSGDRSVTLVDTLGDPERPLDEAGLTAKARALMAWGGLDAAMADRAVTLALAGDDPAALIAWIDECLA